MITLEPYQQKAAENAIPKLIMNRMVFLMFWMRKGKTFTSFYVADGFLKEIERPVVWFITIKTAIEDVYHQYKAFNPRFEIIVINYESVHKLPKVKPHLVILDEVQKLTKFPKPAVMASRLRVLLDHIPIIYLTATAAPESFSQLYHPLWVSSYNPLARWVNFYRFADEFVNVVQNEYKGLPVNDYSDCNVKKLWPHIKHVFVIIKEEEGKKLLPVKHVPLMVNMSAKTLEIFTELKRHKIYIDESRGIAATCNSGAEKRDKLLQISSGTLIFNENIDGVNRTTGQIIDTSKAQFIKSYFHGRKIAILYNYNAEGEMLRKFFPNHTDSAFEFNDSSDLTFISQVRTTKAGINLASADCLVMFNISDSAEAFIQAPARIQNLYRTKSPEVYWIFSTHGPEAEIFKTLNKKKSEYTDKLYAQDQV